MTLPVIVIGGGGHAKVLIDALRLRSVKMLGVTDIDPGKIGTSLLGVPVIGNDEAILRHPADGVRLVNGIGSIRAATQRSTVFQDFTSRGYTFAQVLHPSAVIASDALLAEGAQVMAGAVVQPGCRVGKNVIINTLASIDHDCWVGDHVHISPGATVCGDVRIGDGAHIGAGATVIQGIRIGAGCLIAAGAVVVKDVPDGATVKGVPAREIPL